MSPPRAALVVVAAGTGRRLGAPERKALASLGGRPLVAHALGALLTLDWLDPVLVVGHPADRAALRALLATLPRAVGLVDGGARRQDSVGAGLQALPDDVDLVLVHDAARPFAPVDALAALAEAASRCGAAILAWPVADTIKAVRDAGDGGPPRVERTVPREPLWAAQTPQAFRRAELLALLADAERRGVDVTDEAALYERAGRPVACVTGSRLNFKVTTADDLHLAEALLARAPGRTG